MSAEVRVIVCLTYINTGLYRTIAFRKPSYVGDPVNTVKLFNDKEVDELAVLDITPSNDWSDQRFALAVELAEEAFMPMSYGGKLTTCQQIKSVIQAGYEKVVLNTVAVENRDIVREAVGRFGSQSIVGAMDVKRSRFTQRRHVVTHRGTKRTRLDPVSHARALEASGVGEIIVRSVDHDGRMAGYDLELTRMVADSVSVPVVAAGGAGTILDLHDAVEEGKAHAVCAGSMFVYQGPHRAVLVQYPHGDQLQSVLPRLDV